jgi:hypothetical protein
MFSLPPISPIYRQLRKTTDGSGRRFHMQVNHGLRRIRALRNVQRRRKETHVGARQEDFPGVSHVCWVGCSSQHSRVCCHASVFPWCVLSADDTTTTTTTTTTRMAPAGARRLITNHQPEAADVARRFPQTRFLFPPEAVGCSRSRSHGS